MLFLVLFEWYIFYERYLYILISFWKNLLIWIFKLTSLCKIINNYHLIKVKLYWHFLLNMFKINYIIEIWNFIHWNKWSNLINDFLNLWIEIREMMIIRMLKIALKIIWIFWRDISMLWKVEIFEKVFNLKMIN
jgi:hypothetical protein